MIANKLIYCVRVEFFFFTKKKKKKLEDINFYCFNSLLLYSQVLNDFSKIFMRGKTSSWLLEIILCLTEYLWAESSDYMSF